MRKFLLMMMMGLGLSLSTTLAMEHSVTNAGLEYQDEDRAIVNFTFNNKTDGYHSEMYYIPRLAAEIFCDGYVYTEDYLFLEPVAFEIGANESKDIKYDCIFPENIPSGNYVLKLDFYEKNKKISDYSTNISLMTLDTSIKTDIFSIEDIMSECILVNGEMYNATSGPSVEKTDKVQAQIMARSLINTTQTLIPKIEMYKRSLLGEKISSKMGKALQIKANEEKEILIDLPLGDVPESYLIQVTLLDAAKNQISKVYEFRYVLKGTVANVTYLKMTPEHTLSAGIIGPADAAKLRECQIICNLYDLNNQLIAEQMEVSDADVTEREIIFSIANDMTSDFIAEVLIKYNGEIIGSKREKIVLDKIEGTKVVFLDLVGTKYENAVHLLNGLGIINGYPDGTFRPEASITRAEFTVIADKLAKLEISESEPIFTDLGMHWGKQYVETAAKNGLLSGYPDGTFRPDNQVTYSESLAILLNMLGYKNEIANSSFQWPNNYITKAIEVGLVSDLSIENYNVAATRGDVALMALDAYLMIH